MTYELAKILDNKSYRRLRRSWEKGLEDLKEWENKLLTCEANRGITRTQIKKAILYRKTKLRHIDKEVYEVLVTIIKKQNET